VLVAQYSNLNQPTVYARVLIDSYNPQNPIGTAYYDSSLSTNERNARVYDVYLASQDTVYSAMLMSRQTYLVTVDFAGNSVVYRKALVLLQNDYMTLTRI
jgi:bifunctional pyridoxal-dependent enzyme with beta-cystathionase and maltose regulon repressor activities